jgi:3-oxoacyl-(acyl-carrier-protein) synthase/3-hydroxymyristoyl/3-hydroxydecanoyl-(acyl carrier protein) dehydratase
VSVRHGEDPLAIVGLGALLPGYPTAEAWIAGSRRAAPSLRPVPDGRWPDGLAAAIATRPGEPDTVTTTRGAFLDPFDVDARLAPTDPPIGALDPLTRLIVRVAAEALGSDDDRGRVGLVVASLGLPTTGAVRATATRFGARVQRAWRDGSPLDRHQSGLPATLAAAALGLGGPVLTVDAACASGLYAVRLARDLIASGACDSCLAVGVQRSDSAFLYLGFSQLRALSPTGRSLPLDRRADGLLVGEGGAAVWLMPERRAEGRRVHARLRGVGLGNDGKAAGLLAPDAGGQARCLRDAWARAALDPNALGYLECHATGTPTGDRAELAAWSGLRRDVAVAGAAKGLVGHLITAAGLVGVVRAVGAVRDGILPATPHVEEPAEGLDRARLRVLAEPEPWSGRRIAGVSAFGFGGTNAHAVIDDASGPDPLVALPTLTAGRLDVVGVGAVLGPAVGRAEAARATGGAFGEIPVDPSFRVAPADVARMLPAHRAALAACSEALATAGAQGRVAVVLGMSVDMAIADHVTRLAAPPDARDAIRPAADAARVQGLLPNLIANRTSALLDLRGPSFVVCGEERVFADALTVASLLLASGEADVVLAGAVDGPSHAASASCTPGPLTDGALVLALRRAGEHPSSPRFGTVEAGPQRKGQAIEPAWVAKHGRGVSFEGALGVMLALRDGHDAVIEAGTDGRVGVVTVTAGPAPFVERGPAPTKADEGSSDEVARSAANPLALVIGSAARGGGVSQGPAPTKGDVGLSDVVGRSEATAGRADNGSGARSAANPLAPVIGSAARGGGVSQGPATWSPDGPLSAWNAGPARPVVTVPGPDPAPIAAALPWAAWVGARASSPPERGLPARRTAGLPPAQPLGHAPTPQFPVPPPPAIVAPAAVPEGVAEVEPGSSAGALGELTEIALAIERATHALVEAHGAWLSSWSAGVDVMRPLVEALATGVAAEPPATAPRPAPPPEAHPADAPALFMDRAALERFAAGRISDALGPEYADLDAYEPRVRLPMDPLLLVSRVIAVEGRRGAFGPARILTEYDIPHDAWWSHDGRAPPCVVVESGQADLLLVSILGIDASLQGRRVYRLLDCDLEFHGPRPALGRTLRHDIRINRFARLGDTQLFYFQYDAVDDTGAPVLSMRNGVAGFFTPAELERPKGLRLPPPTPAASGFTPWIAGAPTTLDDRAVDALAAGRHADALGPAFAANETSGVRLSGKPWRVVHRVTDLGFVGGAHGLGGLRAVQDLSDDDWFNPVHFLGDPCMPGTLMYDGCTQALAVWLLATGAPSGMAHGATLEPMVGKPAKLRCRGQVVPGHKQLVYEVRVKAVDLDAADGPSALADVVLIVDGLPAVVAEDVGVRLMGARVDRPAPPAPRQFGQAKLLEFSIGEPSRCFGEAFRVHDHGGPRTARMPGPPLACMTEVVDLHGPQGVVGLGSVTVDWSTSDDAWFLRLAAGVDPVMPLVLLLEGALQPCGWLTAWQGSALSRGDVYFRNLGGSLTVHRMPGAGRLTSTATVTSTADQAGMLLHFFDMEVRDADGPVATGITQFGYFTEAALRNQKGLQPPEAEERRRADAVARGRLSAPRPFSGPSVPKGDLRMVDRVDAVDLTGGRAGLGFYAASLTVRREAWFFVAHFHEDPVMPGSLGLEAIAQLAAWALAERLPDGAGPLRLVPIAHGSTFKWRYRGQVPPTRERLDYEIDVTTIEVGAAGGRVVVDGLVRGDGMPIYLLEGLEVRLERVVPEAPVVTERDGVGCLLDRFDPATGIGDVLLDPAQSPWLDHHRADLVTAALPAAYGVEIAAEAAALLEPGRVVTGVRSFEALRWIHTASGPVTVQVHARRTDGGVAVTLGLPDASGVIVPHMRAEVALGDAFALPGRPPEPFGLGPVDLSPEAYYQSGLTFHGPTLHVLAEAGVRGPSGAVATLRVPTTPAGKRPPSIFDPALLDGATHPMWSGQPEVWNAAIPPGRLAYPVRCDGLVVAGPPPPPGTDVRCQLQLVEATAARLVFDVWLGPPERPWCSFRWTEALVPGGSILGAPPEHRRPFGLERTPDRAIRVGAPTADGGWRVGPMDLAGPLPSSAPSILCHPSELAVDAVDRDPVGATIARVAAKEALRDALFARGVDVHPYALRLVALEDGFVLGDSPTLSLTDWMRHAAPPTTRVVVERSGRTATARVVR